MKDLNVKHAAVAITLAMGLAGCSLLGLGGSNGVTAVNAMDEPVVFFGYERASTYVLDINPEIPLSVVESDEASGIFFLQAGASVMMEERDIGGTYEVGKTLRLFLYEVRGDTAYAKGIMDVRYDELERRRFRIAISGFSGD